MHFLPNKKRTLQGYTSISSTDAFELAVDEKSGKALVQSYDPLKVEPLSYSDISNMVQTMMDASANDPLSRYLNATPLVLLVQKRKVFTIGHGDSLLVRGIPLKYQPPNVIPRIFDGLIGALIKALMSLDTSEQRKRRSEVTDKMDKIPKETFKDNLSRMFEVESLCTAPAKQGRGYGSALVRFVTGQADAAGCATWLISSNIDVPGFYESLGFHEVEKILVGENNPTWDRAPVVLRLMTREPESAEKDASVLV